MSAQTQNELYQQVILEHNKKPRNYGALEDCTHKAEGYNPLCGDHIWVYLKVADDKIEDIRFEGEGCAICKASTSMMTTNVKGQDRARVGQLFDEYQQMVKGQLNPETDANTLGRLKIFASIWQFPSRVKCAALGWHTLKGALDQQAQVSTE